MKFELVDEAKTVFLTSWTSIFAFGATLFGALALMQPHLALLQPLVGPKFYALIVLAADAAPQIAVGLTSAIPFVRTIKQQRLSEIAARALRNKESGDGTQ
jgi:hypothetical protein